MNACMHVCMYVCTHICMSVFVCACVYIRVIGGAEAGIVSKPKKFQTGSSSANPAGSNTMYQNITRHQQGSGMHRQMVRNAHMHNMYERSASCSPPPKRPSRSHVRQVFVFVVKPMENHRFLIIIGHRFGSRFYKNLTKP